MTSLKERAEQALAAQKEQQRLAYEAEKLAHKTETERLARAWILEVFQEPPEVVEALDHSSVHHHAHVQVDGIDLIWTDDIRYYQSGSLGEQPGCFLAKKGERDRWMKTGKLYGGAIRSLAGLAKALGS